MKNRFKIHHGCSSIWLIAFLVFSCTVRENPPFGRTPRQEAQLREYIVAGLRRHNSSSSISTDFGIWIRPIIVAKNNNGIFNFGQIASHASRRNFFVYNDSELDFLAISDTTSLKIEIDKFLSENGFSMPERNRCVHEVLEIINEKDGDAF